MSDVIEPASIALFGITTVAGRYVIGRMEDAEAGVNLFACRLRMIGSDVARLIAPVIPGPGERVAARFASFGTLAGRVRRQTEDGFEMSLDQDEAERRALGERITGFSERLWTGTRDRRSAKRSMPKNPRSMLARPDNWAQPCLIVDYSASGAAVSAAFRPEVGEVVTVGSITAEVVRLFDFGFAVRFFEPQDPATIESLLEAPDAWTALTRRGVV